jgi:hypothetical protein
MSRVFTLSGSFWLIQASTAVSTMSHNMSRLRQLLEQLADDNTSFRDFETLNKFAFEFRDCRLELLRLESGQFTAEQIHRMEQMDYRLQMVTEPIRACRSSGGVREEAMRALAAFGWTTRLE